MKRGILVGYGSIGKRHLLELNKICDEITVVDSNSSRRNEAEDNYRNKVRATDSLDTLSIETVDFAVISSWGPDHFQHFNELVKFKPKFVLFEKPLESSITKLNRLVEAVQELKVNAAVNFPLRYSPLMRKLKSMLISREYGAITNISIAGGAKCISTVGVHWVDFFSTLFEKAPKSVMADLDFKNMNPRHPSLTYVGGVSIWRFEENLTLTIDFSNSSYSEMIVSVFFERGIFRFEGNKMKFLTVGNVQEILKNPPNRVSVFDQIAFEKVVDSEEEPDGISKIYELMQTEPATFNFREQSQSTRQILNACVSSASGCRIFSDETITQEYSNRDWRIS